MMRMGTIRMMMQKQMRLDQLTQPGWGDAADYFRERDIQYGMTEWKVLALGKP
jgi:hypothetical protein